jgi:hypothetical protein
MAKEQAILYAKLQATDSWEHEAKMSYDAQKLTDEYRERLYSEKAKKLLHKTIKSSPENK